MFFLAIYVTRELNFPIFRTIKKTIMKIKEKYIQMNNASLESSCKVFNLNNFSGGKVINR